MRFLPKYSPELNPTELAFNVVKNYLRNERDYTNPVWLETLLALRKLTLGMHVKFYKKCLLGVFK